MGQWLDQLEQRTEERTGVTAHPSHKTIHLTVLEHHGGKIVGDAERIPQISHTHSAVAFETSGQPQETRHFGRCLRINDCHALQRDIIGCGNGFDFNPLADENSHAESPVMEHPCRTNYTRVVAIRKNDPLRVAAELGVNRLEKRHLPMRV